MTNAHNPIGFSSETLRNGKIRVILHYSPETVRAGGTARKTLTRGARCEDLIWTSEDRAVRYMGAMYPGTPRV